LKVKVWTWIVIAGLALGGFGMLAIVSVGILNVELYGRLTETQEAPTHFSLSKDDPVVRLVLHKILPEENSIEASLLFVVPVDSTLGSEIKSTCVKAKAIVEDGSSQHLFAMTAETDLLDATSITPGKSYAAVRSSRFLLPSYPSVASYPFDDQKVRPMITLWTSRGVIPYRLEIQKAFRGRLLTIKGKGGIPEVTLKRASTEVAFILTASLVFLLLSSAVAAALFLSPRGLSSIERLLGVASYLVAAAGFRQLLGVDKVPGTTVLEIGILGLSLVFLCFAVAFSVYRGYQSQGIEEAMGPGTGTTCGGSGERKGRDETKRADDNAQPRP